jgi:hypothetical protein
MAGPSVDGPRCASHEVCHMAGPDACRRINRTPRGRIRGIPSTPWYSAVIGLESLTELFTYALQSVGWP